MRSCFRLLRIHEKPVCYHGESPTRAWQRAENGDAGKSYTEGFQGNIIRPGKEWGRTSAVERSGFATRDCTAEPRAHFVSGRVLDRGEELLKAVLVVENDLFSRVSTSPFIIFPLKIPQTSCPPMRMSARTKGTIRGQFIRPNPSHLRFDFSADLRDGLKRMLQVGARSIKGPNAYQ